MSHPPVVIKVNTYTPAIDWRIDGDEYNDLVLTNYQYCGYTVVKVDDNLHGIYYDRDQALQVAYQVRDLSQMVGVAAYIETANYGKKRE